MFHIVFFEPRIPPNTGNAIRLVAAAGATLHLVEPLGFELTDARLRRAGLDYHDMARVVVHPGWEHLVSHLAQAGSGAIYAFTGHTTASFADVSYQPGDALLMGPEPDGLPQHILDDPRVTARVRIPMMPGIRSLNLTNAAAIAVFEAWRQHSYDGAV